MADPRTDLGAFAAMVGHPLTEWQLAALRLETRRTVILAPRQSGKSRALALLGLWWAFRRREQVVLIVSAGEDASRRLLATVRRIAASSPLLAGSLVDEQASLVRLSNGSEIRSAPASERAIRGASVDLLTMDEAALVSDDVALGAALPTTAARPDAREVFASSPWAEGGFFHAHVMAGDSEHVRVHRWRLDDCAWIDRAVVEAARASMSPARFAAEFEARWASSVDALFSRQVLDRCSADLELPGLAGLRGPARLLGGADWGVTSDRSAFVALARLPVQGLNGPHDRPVFVVCCARAWAPGTPLSDVVREVAVSPAHFAAVSSETNGVGAGPTQELFRLLAARHPDAGGAVPRRFVVVEEGAGGRSGREAFHRPRPRRGFGFSTLRNGVSTSAVFKAFVYERLRWLADRGQLVLPRDGDLLRELAALRVELRPGGDERVEAAVGHDDVADALYLAAGPYRRRDRTVGCYLADLAADPPSEAAVPKLAEDVVETGGGLRVYRRPPLQSANSLQVTIPDGVGEWRPPPSPHIVAARERVADALRPKEEHRG